jgi:putative transposase
MAAGGLNNMTIAQRIGLSNYTVGVWRQRFVKQGLMGLYDEPRPGGPRSIHDEQIARLIRKTLKTKPKNQTHWTCRSIAKETKLSKSTVQRVWKAFSIQPHRQKGDGALCRREKPDPSP